MRISKCFIWFIFFLGIVHHCVAKHIIGGSMSYECLGDDEYRLTLTLYRDCLSGGALFDSDAGTGTKGTVTVYLGNNTMPFIRTVVLGAPAIRRIDTDTDNPCLVVPPNVCVEEGVYVFTLKLPKASLSYHVSYQRCCRNGTILNIVDPDDAGATYTVEITPLAQEKCYDSPAPQGYPPFALCVGERLNIDVSSQDVYPDTDIRYYFCSPLDGGGVEGGEVPGDPQGLNGVAPNPDAPPPYDEVIFNTPIFTTVEPMAGDPVIKIDSLTGVITGIPTRIGQYVVGVCAEQTVNGEVVSNIRRGFQFNVTECKRKVYASLGGEFETESDTLVYQFCGDREITFLNTSSDTAFIETYDWSFLINGNKFSSTESSPTINFQDTGVYYGQMILNKGIEGCSDSISLQVKVYNDILADMNVTLDGCDPTDLKFSNNSFSGNGAIIENIWTIEGEEIITQLPNNYLFDSAGMKPISLKIIDEKGCTDVDSLVLPYYPNYNIIDVDFSHNILCTNRKIQFFNNSSPINSEYEVLWKLSDGQSSTEFLPTFVFENPGEFDLYLYMKSPIGCERDTLLPLFLKIGTTPSSMFSYTPKNLTNERRYVQFINLVEGGKEYQWLVNDSLFSRNFEPNYYFPDTGFYKLSLIAKNDMCYDTSEQIIDVVPLATYFLPNAFSPNNDGKNDFYLGRGKLGYIKNFTLKIFDRYGRMQFETNNPFEGWNGSYMNQNVKMCNSDVYVCKVRYLHPRESIIELTGQVILIR